MGSESRCIVHFGRQRSEGKALLETDHLIFRGEFRLAIPRKSITEVDATDGTLRVTFPDGTARFELGPTAAKWADKIRNPPSLLDKLGVKPGMRVAILGVDDRSFLAQLADRTSEVARKTPKKDTEVIVFGADAVTDLARLAELRDYLTPAGAIWVVHTKGKGAACSRRVVRRAVMPRPYRVPGVRSETVPLRWMVPGSRSTAAIVR